MALLGHPKENTPPRRDPVEPPPPMMKLSLYSIVSNYEDQEYFNCMMRENFIINSATWQLKILFALAQSLEFILHSFSMEDFRRCLERQERETNERNCRADEINELQRQVDEQVLIAVALQDKENQGLHRGSQVGHRRNVERHRHSRGKNLLEDYFIPTSLYSNVDFRRRFRMQPHLFNKVMHDICNYDAYFVQKYDATGVLGLLPEQKLTTVILMLAYGASADQVDEIARMGKSTTLEALVRFCQAVETLYTRDYLRRPTPRDLQRLLQKVEARGFPGMIGSIDCMHWQWKNCSTAWQGDYRNRKGQKNIILEAVAGFDTWVWHVFFGVAGSQNDLNVLGQSPVFNDVLRGQGPNITYQVNNTVYQTGYYLADGIYPRWTTFVKSISNPRSQKQKLFATYQEGYRKDVESRWIGFEDADRRAGGATSGICPLELASR
ncbi:hypothetical protein L3X38_037233 [Prunus dulcis]|uniref:Uncharacterized protein n=1 Tax=Prunus dulcis TaxID=3755 RepID=A0AAD4YQ74_PRUDU|nr:hypothetical protein L3X38_037233 [Prunus dulcis]